MLDVVILFIAVAGSWFLLRSLGGEGSTIKFRIESGNTAHGKRQRQTFLLVFLLLGGALVFELVHQGEQRRGLIIVPFLAGGLAFLVSYLKRKK